MSWLTVRYIVTSAPYENLTISNCLSEKMSSTSATAGDSIMTHATRQDWSWLRNTFWYCPAPDMLALQTQSESTFAWVVDQTVWHITGYRDGYFWGVASTLLTPMGETPDASGKNDSTFYASITPEGRVHITFVRSALSTTVGTGTVATDGDAASFVMQMSSGPGSSLVVHWARMALVQPGDPAWVRLPGAGVSVPDMVGDIAAPTPVGGDEGQAS
ncbi:hypothetical protein [Tahibacter amnicola]|uniref:Uncharacterized protein n=1 Tax=Tahibacter amnicola TaxID=2976241 RepID=A0ABY6BBW6_9GAMM|nr:hypothetical protein [Tahibacter amnicola]UXI67057.1 hypothetical protein N4264_20230 [Tahibacter amnicola]